MRDVELLVRFFAFDRFLPRHVGNLKPLLDMTCEGLNRDWADQEAQIRQRGSDCEYAVDSTLAVFGDNAFRRWNHDRYERPFNRAVYDVMTFYGKDRVVADAMRAHAPRLRENEHSGNVRAGAPQLRKLDSVAPSHRSRRTRHREAGHSEQAGALQAEEGAFL